MSEWKEVAAELEQFLKKKNAQGENEGLGTFFRHPIVITAVASFLVTLGSHYVTNQYQRSEQKEMSIAEFEISAPNELARIQAYASILVDLKKSDCRSNEPDHKLIDPFAMAIRGKTCQDARNEFAMRRDDYVNKSKGSGIPKLRALFNDENIQSAAKNLSTLLITVQMVESHDCGNEAFDVANLAIEHLIEQLVRDVNGEATKAHPVEIDISSLKDVCSKKTLCEAVELYSNDNLACDSQT